MPRVKRVGDTDQGPGSAIKDRFFTQHLLSLFPESLHLCTQLEPICYTMSTPFISRGIRVDGLGLSQLAAILRRLFALRPQQHFVTATEIPLMSARGAYKIASCLGTLHLDHQT